MAELKGREKQIVDERIKKIAALREDGINPYPHNFKDIKKRELSEDIKEKFSKLKEEEKSGKDTVVLGRIMTKRSFGKLAFAKIQDPKGFIQVVIQKELTPEKTVELFKKVDTGDIVGIRGEVIKTKTSEISVLVKDLEILTKVISPLPTEHFGLQEKEERYRRRYLDLIMNPDVKKTMEMRSEIIRHIREFMHKRGFTEVETPLLQIQYGGASARPFKTHINAWDMPMYLSISPELYLKRLVVGGMEKVFTICKNFRNEGVDASHNPEFTMIEAYQAYGDYNDMMELMEECWEYCAKKVLGTTKIKTAYKGNEVEIDLKAPWPRITTQEAMKKYANIDICASSEEDLKKECKKHNLEYPENASWGELVEVLMDVIEEHIVQPTHVPDRAKEGTPLCKRHREDERFNEQCEPMGLGMELGNIYTELNDPELQENLLKEQSEKGRAGDEEAHPMDEDFINTIKTGLPPTGGIGWGIDRMAIIFTGVESIRDIILFPTMKPLNLEEEKKKK
jgi:lysyl-tRNA synthetase class 2